jgi:hypothetical protein
MCVLSTFVFDWAPLCLKCGTGSRHFNCYSFAICFKVREYSASFLLFWIKIAVVLMDFCGSIQTLWQSFVYFCEGCHSYFERDCVDSVHYFGWYRYFSNIDSTTWPQDVFPLFSVLLSFFHHYFEIFIVELLYHFDSLYSKYLVCKWDCFLISVSDNWLLACSNITIFLCSLWILKLCWMYLLALLLGLLFQFIFSMAFSNIPLGILRNSVSKGKNVLTGHILLSLIFYKFM